MLSKHFALLCIMWRNKAVRNLYIFSHSQIFLSYRNFNFNVQICIMTEHYYFKCSLFLLGDRDCTAQYNCCLPATTDYRRFCRFVCFSFLFNFVRCPCNVFDMIVSLWSEHFYLLTYLPLSLVETLQPCNDTGKRKAVTLSTFHGMQLDVEIRKTLS